VEIAQQALHNVYVGRDHDGHFSAECSSLRIKLRAGSFEDASELMRVCIQEYLSPYATARHMLRASIVTSTLTRRKLDGIAPVA
jgi:hypothetical protein